MPQRKQIDSTRYDALMKEKRRLKLVLDHYDRLKGTPAHSAVAAKHKIVTNQIRQLFKV